MMEHCSEPVAEAASYTVTVRGLVLMCSIGIRRREREYKQRVRVSVDLTSTVAAAIREIAGSGHIDLCEGFAERVCTACFLDPRVARVRVWVEKLDVFPDSDGV